MYLLLRDGDKVLLLKRKNTGFADGMYSLVAGHVDGGETLRQAVVREAKEEAGITVYEKDLRLVHVVHKLPEDSPEIERINFTFYTNTWEGEIENKEPEKCDDLSWFNINALPDTILDEVKEVLQHVENGVVYSEFGWEL